MTGRVILVLLVTAIILLCAALASASDLPVTPVLGGGDEFPEWGGDPDEVYTSDDGTDQQGKDEPADGNYCACCNFGNPGCCWRCYRDVIFDNGWLWW